MRQDLYLRTATTSNLRMILDSGEKIRNLGQRPSSQWLVPNG